MTVTNFLLSLTVIELFENRLAVPVWNRQSYIRRQRITRSRGKNRRQNVWRLGILLTEQILVYSCGNSSLRTATGLFGCVATTGGQHAALLRAPYRRNASISRAPTLIPVVDGGWLRSQRAAARNVIRHCRPSRRRRLPLESWRRRRQQPSNDLQVNVSLVACRATRLGFGCSGRTF